MRDYLDANTVAAIASRQGIAPVNFIWIAAKNRTTGALETAGFWNGWDAVEAQVIDIDTRLAVTRTYQAGGSLIEVPAIPLQSDLTVRTIRIRLSQINAAVEQAIRGYDPKHAPVEIHRGFLDTETMLPVAPAVPRFVGYINGAPVRTPAVGGEGGIEIACVSHSRVLTKTNPLKRSDETQSRRLVGGVPDRLRRYTDVAGKWPVHWGEPRTGIGDGG